MVKLSKVNLFLHGFPDPAIHIYDTLTNDARWNEKADLILANPPFMTPKGGVSPHTKFRVSARKAEVLFTDYIAEHLTPDGRGGVIVPNSIVANRQNAYLKLRRFLVEDCLTAVVSLPGGVFKPYTPSKTEILFFDKHRARSGSDVLFVKVTADGYDLGATRTPITANDLPNAVDIVSAWLSGEDLLKHKSKLLWVLIDRKTLLQNKAVPLITEAFVGGKSTKLKGPVVRIADVVQINPGKTDVRRLQANTEVSFVPMEDLPTDRPDFAPQRVRKIGEVITGYTCFRDRDVLLAKITPCFENGKTAIASGLVNGIGFGSTEFFVLRASERILPEFIYYILKRSSFRDEGAENMSGTVGQQRLRRDFLDDYKIPLPSIDEQKAIIAQINAHQAEIARLEEAARERREAIDTLVDSMWNGTIS
jgi:type I restriction enzyme M protein